MKIEKKDKNQTFYSSYFLGKGHFEDVGGTKVFSTLTSF